MAQQAPWRTAASLPIRVGAWGRSPQKENSEGGWVGPSRAQRVLVRDGGVGAQPLTPRTGEAVLSPASGP